MSTNTDHRLCWVTQKVLPADLAGYQLVCSGFVETGDLVVKHGRPAFFATGSAGMRLNAEGKVASTDSCTFYRRIPVPKPGDTDVCPSTGKTYAESKPEPAPHHSTVGCGSNVTVTPIQPGDVPHAASVRATYIDPDPSLDGMHPPARTAAERALVAGRAETRDDGKPPLAYLPWAAIDEMALVQAYGHKKYGDFYNYRRGLEVGRNLSCAIRHIRDYMNGDDKDHESGLNPLAHALTRIAFVLQNLKDGKAIDDRFKAPAK